MKDTIYRILLGLGIAFLIIGGILSRQFPERSAAERYQKRLPVYLAEQEKQVLGFFQDSVFLNYYARPDQVRYLPDIARQVSQLERLERGSYALFLRRLNNLVLINDPFNFSSSNFSATTPSSLINHRQALWVLKNYVLPGNLKLQVVYPIAPSFVLGKDQVLKISLDQGTSVNSLELAGGQIYLEEQATLPNWPVFLLGILGMLLSWIGLDNWLKELLKKERYIPSVLILGLGTLFFGFLGQFFLVIPHSDVAIFQAIYKGPWIAPSTAGVFWSALLFLWICANFFRIFSNLRQDLKATKVVLRASLIYLVSVLLLTSVAYWIKLLILGSERFFNLDDSLQITAGGFLVVSSVIIVLMGVFVFAFTLFEYVKSWSLTLSGRLQLMALSIILSLPLFSFLDLGFPLWTWGLMAFIFLVLFDLFVEGADFNLTWLIVWIIMMATFAASLSYKYILDKDVRYMELYAAQLLLEEDPVLEGKIDSNLLLDPYFTQHYLLDTTKIGQLNFRRKPYNQRSTEANYLGVESIPFKGMDHLDRYAYMLLQNGKLEDRQRQVSGVDWASFNDSPPQEVWVNMKNSRLSLGVKTENTKLIILQRELGSYFKPLSLFAIYFMMFLGVLLVLALLHLIGPVIPEPFYTIFQTRNSLKNRIQLSVIGIILGSSVIIGLVTVWYFKSVSEDRKERAIFQEITEKEQDLEARLERTGIATNWIETDTLLSEFTADRTPLYNLFGPQGNLIRSTLPKQYTNSRIRPAALEALRFQLVPYFLDRATVGRKSSIIGTINKPDGTIAAYLEIPYAFSDRESQLEINNFVGSIFSLYVFFMFIAGGVAIWVANSITEPISQIGEGLRRLQLGNNVPLVWKNKDEIGLLIEEYNNALEKLEESTLQLKASEREGAWREMAKQVAHEIKNPLTPMKLSVQHLLRAYASNPEEIGPLLKRMSNTLIEQIEGLVRIANEFSNFAKMPKAELAPIQLNQILDSVAELFKNETTEVEVHREGLNTSAPLLGDRDQLVRVFNNLIKNAIQAIPFGRLGRIGVRLEDRGDYWQVQVSDNGSGIPEELMGKVFYPNFTTKSSGTGIGLAMSRNIIEQHGGKIYFETQESEGTTFYVEFMKDSEIEE